MGGRHILKASYWADISEHTLIIFQHLEMIQYSAMETFSWKAVSSTNKILLSKRIVTPKPTQSYKARSRRSSRLPYSVQETDTNPAPPPTPVDYFLDHNLDDEELDTLSSLDDWDDVSVDSSNNNTMDGYNIESNNVSNEFSPKSFTVDIIAKESVDNQAGYILINPQDLPLGREGIYAPGGPAFVAHAIQKESYIVGLSAYG